MSSRTLLPRPIRRPSLLVSAFLAALFASCGGVEGTYSHVEDVDGEEVSMSIALEPDGKAVWSMGGEGASTGATGTYKVDGDRVTVTIHGDSTVFTLDGETLKGEILGESFELERE